MKNLLLGIWALLWGIIVTILMWTIGLSYSIGYSFWLTITLEYLVTYRVNNDFNSIKKDMTQWWDEGYQYGKTQKKTTYKILKK